MTLHRTVAELLHGSAAFRPISAKEYAWWYVFFGWRNERLKNRNK